VVIFFDIDGTLLDYESAEETGAVRFFLEHKNVFSMSEPEFLKIWSTLRTKHFERYLRKEVSFAGQRRARIQELYGAMGHLLSDEEADLQFGTYLEHYNRAWKPYDDVIPCLTKLEGFKLGIITNGDYNHQMHKLQRLSIQRFFSLIIASGEVGYSKPDKRIFINACSKAGTVPGQCIYVGDDRDIDCLASQAAGMKGLWLDRKGDTSRHNQLVSINSLTDLPEVIEKLCPGYSYGSRIR
jgi:putative hydrolase of the HAD superfamily